MQAKTTGIILHQVKYSDSQSIVSIYTREFGRMSYMVRGANRKKSATRSALLQPLSIVEIDVSHNPKKDIQTIKDMRIAIPFYHIPYDPVKNGLALFMTEVLQKTLKHSECDENLYFFIESSVCRLDECDEGVGNFHLVFMAQLAGRLGFLPDTTEAPTAQYFDLLNGVFEYSKPAHTHYLIPETGDVFRKLTMMDYSMLSQLPMTRKQRGEMLNHFIEYYKIHLPDFQTLHSVEVLHKLWE